MTQKSPVYVTKEPYTWHKRALYVTQHDRKEHYIWHKRALYVPQKSHIHDTKEPWHKRALYMARKSLMCATKEPYTCRKRALYMTQKSPIHDTKEPYMCHKKTLYMPHKSPIHAAKELYAWHKRVLYMTQKRCVPSSVACIGLFWVMYRAVLWYVYNTLQHPACGGGGGCLQRGAGGASRAEGAGVSQKYVCHDSWVCLPWLMCMCRIVTWLIHMGVYVW